MLSTRPGHISTRRVTGEPKAAARLVSKLATLSATATGGSSEGDGAGEGGISFQRDGEVGRLGVDRMLGERDRAVGMKGSLVAAGFALSDAADGDGECTGHLFRESCSHRG